MAVYILEKLSKAREHADNICNKKTSNTDQEWVWMNTAISSAITHAESIIRPQLDILSQVRQVVADI